VLAALALVLLAYYGLAFLTAATRRPVPDEGLFASPAITLIEKGYMGTPVHDSSIGLPGLERWTYYVMPLHLVLLAGWYKVFGIGLWQMRLLSILWGIGGLAALFVLVRRLTRDVWVATVAAALSATDFAYVTYSSSGRMDGMAAALGLAGLAVYCSLRERNLPRAMLLGHVLVAAAIFTHPNGILFFAGLMFLTVALDRKRIRLAYLAASSVPYFVGAAAWGLYIMQAPQYFVAQMLWKIRWKLGGSGFSPLASMRSEVVNRYLVAYGLGPHSNGVSGPVALKAVVLAAYVAAALILVGNRDLRKNRGCQLLLGLTGLVFAIMMFFNEKLTCYLVNIIPLYGAILAIALVWLFRRGRVARAAAILSFAAVLAVQTGGLILRSRLNLYARQFIPAAEFVKGRLRPGTTVMASADFGFGIGFDQLNDDGTLGFYSHKRPDLIVVDEMYLDEFEGHRRERPEIYRHVTRTLREDYTLIYDHEYYKIYERRRGEPSDRPDNGATGPLRHKPLRP
jgi:4-amino-4-deoxy-L-arabinose transferase-like glycosyltransferase